MQSFLESFNRIIGSINNSYHKAALKFSLSDSELSILYVLNVHGDSCSQSTLYKESGITKTTVNSSVKRMEKENILVVTAGKGRNTCICLTDKGKSLVENTVYKIIQIENDIYRNWTEPQREEFIARNEDYASKLSEAVDKLEPIK